MKSRFEDDEPAGMQPAAAFPAGATNIRPLPVKKPNGSHPAAPDKIPVPEGESAFALTERDIPEPVRLCDPWATEGVNIIAGRPKLGKTTLERQKMAAAAIGGEYLDSKFPHPIKCAFLSLEEGELLCRMKFKMAGFSDAALADIQLFFDWPRGDSGVDLLDRYLTENPEVKLVCIDSLTRFRVIPDVRVAAFMADYEAVNGLHDMSKKHPGVVIDVIHHTRKAKSDDALDDISGTYGLTAACDSAVVMRHSLDGAVMHVYGRLWTRNESQYSLKRGPKQTWEFIGVNLDITDAQKEAYEVIKNEHYGIGGKELGDKLGCTQPSAWQKISELQEKGLVVKRGGKAYAK